MGGFWVELRFLVFFLHPIKQSLFYWIRVEVACLESCRELNFGRKSQGMYASGLFEPAPLDKRKDTSYGENMTFSLTIVTLAYHMDIFWQKCYIY
jgi:hypothetical protein